MLEQHRQNLKRLLLKLDLDALFAQLSRAQIHLKRAEADRPTRWLFAVHLQDVSRAALGPQADSPLDFLKAGIVAQVVEMRHHFNLN